VVGPVCESGDTLATSRALPDLGPGELVAVLDAGAYGSVMSSTYNARPLAAAVMVSGTTDAVIRPRQSFEAMRAGDILPPWLGPLLPPPGHDAAQPAAAAADSPSTPMPAERTETRALVPHMARGGNPPAWLSFWRSLLGR
jgi:hypothetical protein